MKRNKTIQALVLALTTLVEDNFTCLTTTSNRQKFNAEKSSRSIRLSAEKPLLRDFHANLPGRGSKINQN